MGVWGDKGTRGFYLTNDYSIALILRGVHPIRLLTVNPCLIAHIPMNRTEVIIKNLCATPL